VRPVTQHIRQEGAGQGGQRILLLPSALPRALLPCQLPVLFRQQQGEDVAVAAEGQPVVQVRI
jgi:hypothetical protein